MRLALDHGSVMGHDLNRLIVRSSTGMTYGYALDVESDSKDDSVTIFPLSMTAVDFQKAHGQDLPEVSDYGSP